jgi:hypothetical protein
VDCRDGRHDGEAKSEALVRGAGVEQLEGLEDPLGVRRADDGACVRHGQLTASGDGAGSDPNLTGGGVVAGGVVDQVRDQSFGQHRIADMWSFYAMYAAFGVPLSG